MLLKKSSKFYAYFTQLPNIPNYDAKINLQFYVCIFKKKKRNVTEIFLFNVLKLDYDGYKSFLRN